MDITQYTYFLTVAQTGSFQAAAQSLFITRQAVNRSMALMEEELGFPLFFRTKSGLVLTPEGERFLPAIRQLVNKQTQLHLEMRQCAGKRVERIRLYYTFTLYHLYEDYLERFASALRDKVILDVTGCQEADCRRLLHEGKADVLLSTTVPKYSGCHTRLLAQYPLCLMISNENPLANRESLSLADLHGQTFLAYNSGTGEPQYLPDCLRYGLTDAQYQSNDDLIYLFQCVRKNKGILMGVQENLEGLLEGVTLTPFPQAGTWNHYFTVPGGALAEERAPLYGSLFEMLGKR